MPDTLKQSIIMPVPKVCPPQDIKSDLRPIALTSCLAKVLEGFTNKRFLRQVSNTIDPRQYARLGHSTVHALIYLMQAIHEAIDSGNCSVRIFFADFTKGFDVIDHSVLLAELKSFDIDQTLFFWVRSFLTNRVQAVLSFIPVVMETTQRWRPTRNKTRINALCCYDKQVAQELASAYKICR